MERSSGLGRRTFLRLSGVAGVAGVSGVSSASPGREPGPKPNEWLVGVSVSTDNCRATVDRHLPSEANVVHENETLGYASIELPEQVSEQVDEALSAAVEEDGPIKYFEQNEVYHAQFIPNDPAYERQYVDGRINAPAAWEETLGSSDVTIAVVDQGVKYDHPDLEGNMADNPGRDFIDDDSDPYPKKLSSEPHGTHVAGIAAASVDNGIGISGVGNSTLLSVRALSEHGRGSLSDIADAIVWATDQGANVINLSLGGGGKTETMRNAISYAAAQGALVVAAAGNRGMSDVDYPAAYSDCIAVSALDPDGTLASYSNYGNDIELTAPGTNVVSTWVDDGYKAISGTSMATPVISGVAGLTLAKWDLTNEELRTHLKNTAVDIGLPENYQGAGRVDAGAAVTTQPGSGGNTGRSDSDSSNGGNRDDGGSNGRNRDDGGFSGDGGSNDGNRDDGGSNGGNRDDGGSNDGNRDDGGFSGDGSNGGNRDDGGSNGDGSNGEENNIIDSIMTDVSDSLGPYQERDYYSYGWGYDSPSKIVLTLNGPSNADFDIYVTEGSDSLPSVDSYDYVSKSSNSHERITIDAPDQSAKLYVLVHSYSGEGEYTLTFSEYN